VQEPRLGVTKAGRFAYETSGDDQAIPLVFLHGIGGAARAWRRQLGEFGSKFRAIAWDMPGYGRSKPLVKVSIGELAAALGEFLEELEAARPILVGHSIGAMIVQQWLVQQPHAARAVVLAQTSPAFGRPDGDWQTSFIAARLGPLDRGETMRSLAPTLVDELIGEKPDRDGVEVARECMASVPEASYRAMMMALIGFDCRGALGDIAVPTLVLSGSRDNNAPASMMAKMASHIRSARYVELEGAGHLANLERPTQFNAALNEFLRECVPTVTGAAGQ
jgi:3-oxoadipate enol-lactonase